MTTLADLPPAQPLLPERSRADRPLLVIMAVMAFLAGLALLTASWATRAGDIWTSDLDGRLSVQVMQADQADQALALLDARGLDAELLSDDDTDALLEPWLGNATLPDDIPVPRLISVRGGGGSATDLADALAAELGAAGIVAEVDDHQRWADGVRAAALWVRLAALAVLSIIFAAAAATSGFATEAALRSEETVIRVLGQVGAQDRFVSRLFVSRFFFAGLKAGIIGSLGALAFGVLLGLLFGAPFGVGASGLFWLVALPVLFGAMSAAAAGYMALAQLRSDRAAR